MKRYAIYLSALALTSLTACSTITDVFTKPSPSFLSLQEAKAQIDNAPICCANNIFNSKNIINVTKTTEKSYMLDQNEAEAFNFETGKSFFQIFQLPLNMSYLQVVINPVIISTVFKPRVDFYNADKVLISTLKSSAFKYRDKGLGNGYLEAKLNINNAAAPKGHEYAYMVIYTTDEAQEEKTGIINPAVKLAIAKRQAIPDMPDLQIPHAPIGEIEISFKFKQEEEDTLDSIISYLDEPLIGGHDSDSSNRQESVVLANGVAYSVSSQTEGSTAVTSIDSQGNQITPSGTSNSALSNIATTATSNTNTVGTMMEETENMYNDLIKKAVVAGDLTKAMNLVGEAKRLGSKTAQEVFIKAVKSSK